MHVNFAKWLVYKLLWDLWKFGYGGNVCGLLCHFKQSLKLNFHIWLSSRTRLCFGQNMESDKQAQSLTGSGHTWMISENTMLYDLLKMLYLHSAKKSTINWFVAIYYFCVSFLGQFIIHPKWWLLCQLSERRWQCFCTKCVGAVPYLIDCLEGKSKTTGHLLDQVYSMKSPHIQFSVCLNVLVASLSWFNDNQFCTF